LSLTTTEFERGVAYWLNETKWDRDFHNGFYTTMAETNPHGAFDDNWWAGFLPVLRAWIATRPKGSAFLTPRAQERFAAMSTAWALCVEPRLGEDIASVEWRDVAAFPALVAEIKDVASPVFASKFCHFLAPRIFPIVDNAAMGNPYSIYEAGFNAYRSEWHSTGEAVCESLVSRLSALIEGPLAVDFPMTGKVVELCLIGRNQSRAARETTT